jgi:AcrR family transcriptional regulator
MARIVKEQEYTEKRNEILEAAQRLIYSKGYERMTIQDVLDELRISKGAFYHYFESKQAVLEALIERMQQEVEQVLLPIVRDPDLSALEKLQQFLATLERSGMAHNAFIADLVRVWFADENAIVREKVYEAMNQRRAPLLTEIIDQGIQEGVFTTAYPDQLSDVILSLARGMGSSMTRLMLRFVEERDESGFVEGVVAVYGVYSDALERVLGAPMSFLHRLDTEAAHAWAASLRLEGK